MTGKKKELEEKNAPEYNTDKGTKVGRK